MADIITVLKICTDKIEYTFRTNSKDNETKREELVLLLRLGYHNIQFNNKKNITYAFVLQRDY